MAGLLTVQNVSVHFGTVRAVQNCSLRIVRGTATSVVGLHGAGKSTLGRIIAGDIVPSQGVVGLAERDGELVRPLRGLEEAVALGVFFIPASGAVYRGFSVVENLAAVLAALEAHREDRQALLDGVYEMFPVLWDRRGQLAGSMSGGEAKLLAIARGVLAVTAAVRAADRRSRPTFPLLIVDEPTHGLHPASIVRVGDALRTVQERDTSLLIIEEKSTFALDLAQVIYVMRRGEIIFCGNPRSVRAEHDLVEVGAPIQGLC